MHPQKIFQELLGHIQERRDICAHKHKFHYYKKNVLQSTFMHMKRKNHE